VRVPEVRGTSGPMHARISWLAPLAVVVASACLIACSGPADTDPAAQPRVEPVRDPLPEAPPPVPPSPDAEDQRRTNDALAVAATAAEEAAHGTDECESAHNQLVAMLETVERELGEQVHKPERAEFLAICREMPADARRCIVPTTAMANQDACSAALEALPDDLRQRFQAVVNGPLSD